MHIVQVIASIGASDGGTSRFMSDICSYLPDVGGSYSLITLSEDYGLGDLPIDSRLEIIKLQNKQRSQFLHFIKRKSVIPILKQLSLKKSLDVVHSHGIWLDICRGAVHWARLQKASLVISPHGMLEPWALNHKNWKKRLAMWLYQRRDLQSAVAFHACSDLEAESIRRLGLKQPIAIIPNGVDLPLLNSNTANVKTEIKTVLFLSRINPKKGLHILLDGWKKVAPNGWRLVIAGNDDSNYLPALKRKIKELRLTSQVEITGPLFDKEKEKAYQAANFFVLPSYSENFGIVVAEALSYGVPVLTTKGCPWQELQTHDCGWWVEPTLTGIKSGLETAFNTTPKRLIEMGMRGRDLVEANYQWPEIASNMFQFYKWILGKDDAPDCVRFD